MYVNIYIYMNLHVRLQYMYMHIRIHMQIHIQRKSKASPCTYTYVLQKHVHVQKHMQTHLQRLLHIHIYIHKHIHSLERSQHQPSIRVEWVLFILVSCPSRTSKVTWESLQTCHDRSDPQYCRLIPWSLMIRLVSEKGLGSPKKIPLGSSQDTSSWHRQGNNGRHNRLGKSLSLTCVDPVGWPWDILTMLREFAGFAG